MAAAPSPEKLTPSSEKLKVPLPLFMRRGSDAEVDGLLNNEELDNLIRTRFFTPSYIRAQRRRALLRLILFFVLVAGMVTALTILIVRKLLDQYAAPYAPTPYSLIVQPYDPTRLVSNGTHFFASTVIVISIDGFRADYINRGHTPNLLQLSKDGVHAEYMTPAFPSVTFPNHYTLVTGLYPESHGIVGNEFFDPHLNANFSYRDPKRSWDSKWWGGEPIWVTSVLQNKSSAVLMWPGCSSAIRNTTPTYHVDYNDNMTQVAKMDKLLEWIDLPLERRPQLLAAYIPEVDKNGHKAGPESDLVNLALEEVDGMIKHLLIGLAARNLTEIVNIVIVSDHGMTSTSNSRLIYYDDILTPDAFSHVGTTEGWPLLLIRSTDANTTDTIYKQLRDHTLAVPSNFTVYLREDVPQRFHFSATDRIPQIVAIPDVGYVFVTHNQFNDSEPYTPRGIHGYDNLAEDMRALFVARGPAFDGVVGGGKVVRAFDNVEVYGILAKVLGLTPALNNGTWDGSLQMV